MFFTDDVTERCESFNFQDLLGVHNSDSECSEWWLVWFVVVVVVVVVVDEPTIHKPPTACQLSIRNVNRVSYRQVIQGHKFLIWNDQTQQFWNPLFVWFETTIHFGCFKCTKVCSVGYFDPSILGLLGGEVTTGQLGWPKPWIESNVDVMHLRS